MALPLKIRSKYSIIEINNAFSKATANRVDTKMSYSTAEKKVHPGSITIHLL